MPEEKKGKKEEKQDKALGEQIWDSTKEFFVKVKEDADKSIKILSLKSEVSRLNREKNILCTKLGEIAYQKITLGSLQDSELTPTADEISKLQQEIDDKERQIEEIKDAISSAVQEKPPAVKKKRKAAKPKEKKSAPKARKSTEKKAAKS